MSTPLDTARYALRQFRAAPMFTLAAVLTLALGIGGTTAIFTLIHAVMLKSLPVADPARLYRIGSGDDCCVLGGLQDEWGLFSYPLYQRLRAAAPEFEDAAAFQAAGPQLSVRRERSETAPRPLHSEFVSGNYFSVLGVRAFGGRMFTPADDKDASPAVAVISHHAWQTAYGADPAILGSTVVVEGNPFTVIGIAPPGFFGETLRGDPPDLWLPLHQEPAIDRDSPLLNSQTPAWLRVMGRLRAGATLDGVGPRLTGLLRNWIQHEADTPKDQMEAVMRALPNQVINVVPAGAGVGVMKAQYGRSLNILLAVCGLVLLIACANVANLLLARAVARRGQTAVRLAIGASRRHLVGLALAESLLLGVSGAVAGLLVAMGAARLLLALAFANAQFLPIGTSPSPLVLGFAMTLALLTAALFGAAPAWFMTRTDPIDALRGAGRGTRDRSSGARKVLLVIQATLSVVLVAGATLLSRSLSNLESQDFGFQLQGRVLVAINRPPSTYSIQKLNELYRDIEDRLARLPGVQGTGLALYNPHTDNWGLRVLVQGHPLPRPNQPTGASFDRVSAKYLQNLGVAVVRGRAFTAADDERTEPVAVVNEAFVKRFFKDSENPTDQHFGLTPDTAGRYRIVGIVRDAKFAGFQLDRPARPMFYFPLAQTTSYSTPGMQQLEARSHSVSGILLVTTTAPSVLEPQLRKALAEVDPNLTITSVRTLQQQVEMSFDQQRAVAGLAALFGVVALALAAIGLYSVTSYSVAQQTNEIGLRMALGADRIRVVSHVLGGAFRWVAAGLVVGVPLAIGAGKLVAAQLYGVTIWDPLALALAAGALGGAALIAALIPARRAAGISPMDALRAD